MISLLHPFDVSNIYTIKYDLLVILFLFSHIACGCKDKDGYPILVYEVISKFY